MTASADMHDPALTHRQLWQSCAALADPIDARLELVVDELHRFTVVHDDRGAANVGEVIVKRLPVAIAVCSKADVELHAGNILALAPVRTGRCQGYGASHRVSPRSALMIAARTRWLMERNAARFASHSSRET